MSDTREKVDDGLIRGRITDDDIAKMRMRIGYPNPTLRKGYTDFPWNPTATADCVRRWALSIGDANPFYANPEIARGSCWGASVAPPGFEWSMGWDRTRTVSSDLQQATRGALRGVQLYHSGAEYFYHKPIVEGTELFKSEWVADVEEKVSSFASRSVIVNNANCYWDRDDNVYVTSSRWFVHAERQSSKKSKAAKTKDEAAYYSDEQLAEIEAAYDAEYIRGADTLYIEDVSPGMQLPVMVKGPLTITDLINFHMGAGWLTYGNPPFKLAYENRKRLKGFYSRNEFNAWDTIQRVHWDPVLAEKVGVLGTYDIGPMRYVMVCQAVTNFMGNDAWLYRLRYELRNFNYVGDTTWLSGTIVEVTPDAPWGPSVEIEVRGVNQRGQENVRASVTVLLASRRTGPVRLPPAPAVTSFRD
ncbi:acyl dehydratase [Sphingomonas sp. DBB INV C78]|uniref:FAS1-like dehydratase domain-containing protein n=1 Tax=Sphingomonas sp. DBB INV C78 TaxID=3349434 RepID=UPI0036D3BC49